MFISKTKINKSNDTVSIKLHDFAVEEMYDYIVPDFLCLKKKVLYLLTVEYHATL